MHHGVLARTECERARTHACVRACVRVCVCVWVAGVEGRCRLLRTSCTSATQLHLCNTVRGVLEGYSRATRGALARIQLRTVSVRSLPHSVLLKLPFVVSITASPESRKPPRPHEDRPRPGWAHPCLRHLRPRPRRRPCLGPQPVQARGESRAAVGSVCVCVCVCVLHRPGGGGGGLVQPVTGY